jgi:hypothetical protein
LRESSSTGPGEDAVSERWSTQARTGSRESLLEIQEEVPGGHDVSHVPGARRSVRVSMAAGPLSGPPSPPVSGPL